MTDSKQFSVSINARCQQDGQSIDHITAAEIRNQFAVSMHTRLTWVVAILDTFSRLFTVLMTLAVKQYFLMTASQNCHPLH